MSDEVMEPFELFEVEKIQEFGMALLEKLGVPQPDAELLIDSLIKAEQWGHDSHGLLRLSWYTERLKSGAMKALAEPTYVIDSGPLLVIDGHDAMGQVLTKLAADEAVKRARQFGISAVGVRDSNHFGTAMYFTRMIAKQNCVAILSTNASPSMAPWGGSKKVLGNNPWSIAAPYGETVVALDMANTVVARGKLYAAKSHNQEIPENWAITKDGKKTTDAAAGIEGVILPMGEHKGYAISFMMDVISGALTGSGIATEVHGPYEATAKSNAGHLLIVIDIEQMLDLQEFDARVSKLVAEMKSVPLAEGFSEIFYPGEIENNRERQALESNHVRVYQSTKDELNKFAMSYGLHL